MSARQPVVSRDAVALACLRVLDMLDAIQTEAREAARSGELTPDEARLIELGASEAWHSFVTCRPRVRLS